MRGLLIIVFMRARACTSLNFHTVTALVHCQSAGNQNMLVCEATWSGKQLPSVLFICLCDFVANGGCAGAGALLCVQRILYAILVMDYVNATICHRSRSYSHLFGAQTANSRWSEINIYMTCLWPLRWIAIYLTGLALSHHRTDAICKITCSAAHTDMCLHTRVMSVSIALPACHAEKWKQNRTRNLNPLCTSKTTKSHVYNKLNCKWHQNVVVAVSTAIRPVAKCIRICCVFLLLLRIYVYDLRSFVFRFRWFLSALMMKKRNSRSAM